MAFATSRAGTTLTSGRASAPGATLLTGGFADDEQTIYNLAVSAAKLRGEVDRLTQSRGGNR